MSDSLRVQDDDPASRPIQPADESAETAELIREITGQLGELREFVGRLVDARVDLIRLRIRRGVLRAGACVALFVIVLTTVGYSTAYVLSGAAGGLTELAGGRAWVGSLAAGVGGLCGSAVVALLAWNASSARRRREQAAKYEAADRRREDHEHHAEHHARDAT